VLFVHWFVIFNTPSYSANYNYSIDINLKKWYQSIL
jgi:hypothetical protein